MVAQEAPVEWHPSRVQQVDQWVAREVVLEDPVEWHPLEVLWEALMAGPEDLVGWRPSGVQRAGQRVARGAMPEGHWEVVRVVPQRHQRVEQKLVGSVIPGGMRVDLKEWLPWGVQQVGLEV